MSYMYKDFGFKKGYWSRIKGLLEEYLDERMTLDELIQNISEETRGRKTALEDVFISIQLAKPLKLHLLKKAKKRCIELGFITKNSYLP